MIERKKAGKNNTPGGKGIAAPGKQGVAKPKPRAAEKPAEVMGIYEQLGAFGRVIPDDRREIKEIMILQGHESTAHQGDRVVVELTPQHSYRNLRQRVGADRVGRVVEVLGAGGDLAVGQKAVIRRLGLRQSFTRSQLEQAAKLNRPVDQDQRANRLDWRDKLLVTIDGEDTRDIDDAISLEALPGGRWLLGVHIADVAHYVKAGSLLDKEAYARGTSVYFPDQVLPMLPPDLSNGICSLNAGQERLALSCLMTLEKTGQVVAYEIRPSVIQVKERLTYPQVQGYYNRLGLSTREALAGQGGKGEDKAGHASNGAKSQAAADLGFADPAVGLMLLNMARLCLVLRQIRLMRGALDFELPECRITPGRDGKAEELKRKKPMLSEMVIEELMILANETVAGHYRQKGVPFPYRIHEKPEQDRIFGLNQMLLPLGLSLKSNRTQGKGQKEWTINSASYQQLLQSVKGTPKENLVGTLLLRSLNHALYSPKEAGHFGLASPCYCHFTSPIRRYADLMVHRIIKELGMTGALAPEESRKQRAKLEKACEQASSCERLAEEGERKVESLWKADYMSQFIGEEFPGIINGVTAYGLYVSLENTAEGMVHISRLQGYYVFDDKKLTLESWQEKKTYRLGDPVRVRLESTDPGMGHIDFSLVEAKTQTTRPGSNQRKGKKGAKA